MGGSAATRTQCRPRQPDAALRVGLLLLDREDKPLFASPAAYQLLGCNDAGLTAAWASLRGQLAAVETFAANAFAADEINVDDFAAISALAPRNGAGEASDGGQGGETAQGGRLQQVATAGGQALQLEVIPLRGQPLMGSAVLLRETAVDALLSAELLLASRMRAQTYLFNALVHDLRAPLHALEINLELLDDSCRRTRGDQIPAEPSAPAAPHPLDSPPPSAPADSAAPMERLPGMRVRRQSDQIVAVLKEELARLNRALRMLLDHGAPQPPALDDVDLAALLRELAVLLRPQARQQRVALELELAQSVLLVHGQRDQLRQALLNIAINSLEAMPAGGTLTLALSRAGAQARVVIADSGPGMPPAMLERGSVGARFSTKPDGTGMGLFVASLIASGHGGALEIGNRDSVRGAQPRAVASGAEVALVLPIATLRAVMG